MGRPRAAAYRRAGSVGTSTEIGGEEARLVVALVLGLELGVEGAGDLEGRAGQIVDDRVAEPGLGLEDGDAAPAVAATDDVVVGAVELPTERALKGLDLVADPAVVGGDPEDADLAGALDVGLIALADDQEIDGVGRRQRADDVAELTPAREGPGTAQKPVIKTRATV